MKINFSLDFSARLNVILEFIALDSLDRSLKFYNDILTQIKNIPNMPYKYRKNSFENNKNVRDLNL